LGEFGFARSDLLFEFVKQRGIRRRRRVPSQSHQPANRRPGDSP
jgi:hypothetical protein